MPCAHSGLLRGDHTTSDDRWRFRFFDNVWVLCSNLQVLSVCNFCGERLRNVHFWETAHCLGHVKKKNRLRTPQNVAIDPLNVGVTTKRHGDVQLFGNDF
jgi:hypothetical protein